MCSELKLVHGKPRHSQSQGSTKRANQDVQMMTWLQIIESTHWADKSSIGLVHEKPFLPPRYWTATLWGTVRVQSRLSSSNLPTEVVEKLISEEDVTVYWMCTGNDARSVLAVVMNLIALRNV